MDVNRLIRLACLGMTVGIFTVIPVVADDSNAKADPKTKAPIPPAQTKPVSDDPQSWNIDSMIRQAGENVSKRYNCNEEQTQFTKDMMEAGVNKFLRENQDEIWPLLRELWPYQVKGELPDSDTAKRIAKRLLPLIERAQKTIHEANDIWAQRLSPEQRKLYEFDRKEMDDTFEQMRTNFKKWESGEVVPQPIFPRPEKKPTEPPKPSKPDPDQVSGPPNRELRATNKAMLMGEFQRYVEKFIRDYKLDATQAESARSILREMDSRADAHLSKVKPQMDEVLKKKLEARKNAEWKKYVELDKEIETLNAPVKELFDELKDRLNKIPTEDQKRAYEEAQKKAAEEAAKPKPEKKPVTPKTSPKKAKETPADGEGSSKEKPKSTPSKAKPSATKDDKPKDSGGDKEGKPEKPAKADEEEEPSQDDR